LHGFDCRATGVTKTGGVRERRLKNEQSADQSISVAA
jgi:hypothetical protein